MLDAICGLAAILWFCTAPAATPVEAEPRVVRTELAELAAPMRRRSFPAVLEPPQITPLAFDVGGRLGPVELRIGQDVSEGEVLASVEAQSSDLQLRQAEAALTEAEAAAANASEEARRQERLFERGVAAEAARDRARTEARQAEARAEQQRRNLDLQRETLADTELRAPFDGVVNSIEVDAYGSVAAGEPVITLYPHEAGLQATILVSYAVASELSLGDAVKLVTSDGDPAPLAGEITEIARRAPAVSSFPVVVALTQTRPDLRSGMAVEVRLDLPASPTQGISLPISAIATQRPASLGAPDGNVADMFVFRPEDGAEGRVGRVEPRTVRLGAVSEDRVFVTDGIAPGTRVVTAGVPFLHPGMKVRLEEDAVDRRDIGGEES